MASGNDSLGDLVVTITGEFDKLQAAIDAAVAKSQAGADDIQSALTLPNAGDGMAQAFSNVGNAAGAATGQLDLFGEAAQTAGSQLELFAGFTPSLSEHIDNVGQAAGGAVAPVEALGGAAQQTGQEAHEAEGGIAGMAEQLATLAEALIVTEGLKEFGQEALKAFGTVQSVTIGLTELTKSAESAAEIVEKVKELAATEPFAFPEIAPTIQKMVALGVSAEQIPGVMHAVADAAAATGNSFAAVASSFDRMTLSGTVSARSLVQLGVNTEQLGRAMGITAEQVKAAFASLDQSQRIEALESALGKFAGAAEAQAKGIAGQWQIFQNQFEEVMVAVGDALAPVVGDILAFGKSAISEVQGAIDAFNKLPEPVKEVAVGLGLVVAAVAPLAAAMSALGFAIIGFNTAWTTGASILQRFSVTAGEAAVADEALAVAAGEATVAIEAETVATNELAVARGRAAGTGAAAGTAAEALGLAMSGLAVATAAASGAFAGWKLGEWLNTTKGADVAITQMTAGMGAWSVAAESATVDLKALSDAFPALSEGIETANGHISDVTKNLGLLLEPLAAVTKQQLTANSALDQARVALELAKVGYSNASLTAQQHALALQVLQRAQANYDDALSASVKHGKDWADSIGGITEAIAKAQEKFQSLATIFAQLSAAQDGNARSNSVLAEVYSKLESAAKASGNAFADYRGILAQVNTDAAQNYAALQQLGVAYGTLLGLQKSGIDVTAQLADVYQKWQQAASKVGESITTAAGEMAKLVQSAQGQQTALEGVAGAFQRLANVQNPTLAQQQALQDAFKKLTTDANALGLEVQAVGNSIVFTAQAGAQANPALKAYADLLTQQYGNVLQLVNVNGKWQASAQSMTGAQNQLRDSTKAAAQAAADAVGAIKNHSGSLDDNAAASARARQAQIDLGSTYQTTRDLVIGLTNSGKQQVSSLEDSVKAFVDLNSQTQTTVAGQIALQNAFKNAQAAGAALGITITQNGATTNSASKAVQDLAKELNDAIQKMNGGSAAGNNFSGVLRGVASAADAAAGSINKLASAEKDWIQEANQEAPGGGFGGKNMSPSNAEGYLALMASMGADNFELDQAAQAFGLVPVGNRQYVTKDEYIKMTGGVFQENASGQLVGKPKDANTDAFGRPLAASASGSSSGVTALSSAATAAATAVTNLGSSATSSTTGVNSLWQAAINGTLPITALGTAATGAAVPLGAFVTGTTGATVAVTALSDSVANLDTITGQLSDASKRNIDEANAEADALAKANPDLQAFADTVKASSDAQATLNEAMDALQRATDRDNTAVEQGRLTQEAATRDLLTYAQAVQKATDALNAFGTHLTSINSDVTNPQKGEMTVTPASPSTQSGFTDSLSNPQRGVMTVIPAVPGSLGDLNRAGIDLKSYTPLGGLPSSYSAPSVEGATTNGGTTFVVNVTGGNFIGPNAARDLAKLTMPEMVNMLRQAGQKI